MQSTMTGPMQHADPASGRTRKMPAQVAASKETTLQTICAEPLMPKAPGLTPLGVASNRCRRRDSEHKRGSNGALRNLLGDPDLFLEHGAEDCSAGAHDGRSAEAGKSGGKTRHQLARHCGKSCGEGPRPYLCGCNYCAATVHPRVVRTTGNKTCVVEFTGNSQPEHVRGVDAGPPATTPTTSPRRDEERDG